MSRGQRVAILVDSENVEIAVADSSGEKRRRRAFNTFPDWRKILSELVGARSLVRLIYFKEKNRPLSKKFAEFWESDLLGEIERPVKSADPAIIITAVTLAEKMDTIVLVSGDKDFVPLIPFLKAKGCKVEVASFMASAAADLRKSADKFHKLDDSHTVKLKRSGSSEGSSERRPRRRRSSTK